LMKLYTDCQSFAEGEVKSLLERFEHMSDPGPSAHNPEPR
jgi:hypothetical protein